MRRTPPLLTAVLLPVLPAALASAVPVYDDVWDVSNGTTIIAHSPFDHDAGQGYNASDVFGAFLTADPNENGNVVFDDASPSGFTDFISWRTANPVTLNSFELTYRSDTLFPHRRKLAHFTLYERLAPADPWVPLFDADTPPDGPSLRGAIPAAFPATDFRAEFTRDPNNADGWGGPRIVELDGFVPEPGTAGLALASMLPAAVSRRRRRTPASDRQGSGLPRGDGPIKGQTL